MPAALDRPRARAQRRLAAVAALTLAPVALLDAVGYVAEAPAHTFSLLLSLALVIAVGWYGVVRRGVVRIVALALSALLAAGVVEALLDARVVNRVILVGLVWLSVAAAAAAFAMPVPLAPARRPRRPVLFVNPRSGDGKAARLALAEQARARGIEVVELGAGDDLRALAEAAAEGRADALAMAGGDGSQAVVAAVAAGRALPYACIPSGTRNHFALDLGVDRDDPVGALDALVDGGERLVDLAEVNGRVFVNNVSLGVYATALQRDGYRAAKVRTLVATLPDVAGPRARAAELSWALGEDGRARIDGSASLLLVSNNRHRIGGVLGVGTRPRLDEGRLGVAVLVPPRRRLRRLLPRRGWREWTARQLEVRAQEQVPVGIDGEAALLDAPLEFRSLPRALRVRVAAAHPGASPSAAYPRSIGEAVRTLVAIAAGRERRPEP